VHAWKSERETYDETLAILNAWLAEETKKKGRGFFSALPEIEFWLEDDADRVIKGLDTRPERKIQ
jgi:hypothetical protein